MLLNSNYLLSSHDTLLNEQPSGELDCQLPTATSDTVTLQPWKILVLLIYGTDSQRRHFKLSSLTV